MARHLEACHRFTKRRDSRLEVTFCPEHETEKAAAGTAAEVVVRKAQREGAACVPLSPIDVAAGLRDGCSIGSDGRWQFREFRAWHRVVAVVRPVSYTHLRAHE